MKALRRLLRVDGDLGLVAGVVAIAAAVPIGDALSAGTSDVRVVGVLLLLLGLEALTVAAAPDRWLRPAALTYAVSREVVLVLLLLVGLAGGVGWADAVVALLVADVALLGMLELRAARRLEPGASGVVVAA